MLCKIIAYMYPYVPSVLIDLCTGLHQIIIFSAKVKRIITDYIRYIPKFYELNWLIGLVGRVFAHDPGDLGSIPGRIIPKTQKWYLIPPWLRLSNIRYVYQG